MVRTVLMASLVAGLATGSWFVRPPRAGDVVPVTLHDFQDPGPNTADEPLASHFSPTAAARFLDSASLYWTSTRKCFTCHTNYAYLYARPSISLHSPAHTEVRREAERLVTERWKEKGPRWDAEVIATAAALAFNDSQTTRRLSPVTKTALDAMWTKQRADGGFTWIRCGWPPMELDDHYGVTLAAIAAGVAPENYASSEPARKGLDGIRTWLKSNPAPALHHRAMTLWAATMIDGVYTEDEKRDVVEALTSLQRDDGGWNFASLGPWERGDEETQDLTTSDGYGTGFVLFVLRKAGLRATDPRLAKGVTWLKANQRSSGRWFTRSAFKDNKHFITHAGTAFAVMALKECGEMEASAP